MIAYALFATLLILTIAIYNLSDQNLASPGFLFVAPFTIAAFNLLFNISRWNVELHMNTYCVIIGGTLCYLLGVFLTKAFLQRIGMESVRKLRKVETVTKVDVSRLLLAFWVVFQVAAFLVCLQAIRRVASRNGYGGSIISQIGGYKTLGTFSTVNVSLGTIPDFLYSLCTNAGYVWFYLLIRNYFAEKKVDKLLVINLILTFVFDLSKGGRQSMFQLLVAGLVIYLIFLRRARYHKRIPKKTIFIFVLAAIIVIGSFQAIGNFLGRNSVIDFSHYIAVYLSAPIRNLDAYLQKPVSSAEIFGQMSFVRLINGLGGKLGIREWVYELDLPFLYANGKSCGNVYTTFYAYIYDFGYAGAVILPFLMGCIAQIVSTKSYRSKKGIEFSVILYGFLAFQVAFSFFSNKFYEAFVNIVFFRRLIDWAIVIVSVKKIGFRLGKYKG